MDTSLTVLYFVPLAILIAFGPNVARRYRAAGVTVMMLTVSLCVGLILAILGGQHQRHLIVRSSVVGMFFAGFFFTVLISVPTVSLVFLSRRGATLRRQRVIPLIAGLAIQVVAWIPYIFGVGCALTGECL
jgi:hypothetical protein